MSQLQLLRLFINERLSAAAEDIFAAVQRTISQYEQDNDQHGLKEEADLHSTDTPKVFACVGGQELSPKSCQNNPKVDQEDCGLLPPETPSIKQEVQEPWSRAGQQLTDMDDSDTGTLKVTPTCMNSCIYSDMTELQNHDTGNEDRKLVPNTADPKKVEEISQSTSEHWTHFPDCSVTLSDLGSELDLETLTGYAISKVHAQSYVIRNQLAKSCEPHSLAPPNKETKRRSKSYCCRFCGKEFSHSAHLATHSQIHSGEKLFTCEVCGKEFRHSNSVTVHMRIHTDEKPYCCRTCGKEFRHVGNLNVHMRIHTGEKPYSCTVCGKKFSRNNLMTKHMAVHTGEMTLSLKSV